MSKYQASESWKYNSSNNIYDLSQYSNVIKFDIKKDNNLNNKFDYNNNDIKNDLGINNYSKYEEINNKDGGIKQTISQTLTNYEHIQDNYLNDVLSDAGSFVSNVFGIDQSKIKTYLVIGLISIIIFKKL